MFLFLQCYSQQNTISTFSFFNICKHSVNHWLLFLSLQLKERTRSGGGGGAGDAHPQSSQDTSLNTTPSWNSVASSTSDESLNTNTVLVTSAGGMPMLTKSNTLDTVIEVGVRHSSVDDHVLVS